MTCDPVGAKIGNGGATMHVLEQLQTQVDAEQLQKGSYVFSYQSKLIECYLIFSKGAVGPCWGVQSAAT